MAVIAPRPVLDIHQNSPGLDGCGGLPTSGEESFALRTDEGEGAAAVHGGDVVLLFGGDL